jgi:hypothetical protein
MIVCNTDGKSNRLQVKHYPGMRNIAKTATFDFSEEIAILGVAYSREARRMQGDGRLFAAECSGVCLACNNPFSVYRIVQTSGPVPGHLSGVDFEHGYLSASIFDTGITGLANSHLLEDVLHHGNFYGYWLESWSEAVRWWTLSESEVAGLVDASIAASKTIGSMHKEARRGSRVEARIN